MSRFALAAVIVALAFAGGLHAQPDNAPEDGREAPFTVSPETTVLTGPVRPDGTVDYIAALNEQLSEGVTPDNNAKAVWVRLVDPDEFIDDSVRDRYYKELGVEPPADDARFFLDFEAFLQTPAGRRIDLTAEQAERSLEETGESVWRPRDHPAVAAWLEYNADALDRFVDGTKRPRYYAPLLDPQTNRPSQLLATPLPGFDTCRAACDALSRRSLMSGANSLRRLRDIEAIQRTALLLAQGPSPIERFVSLLLARQSHMTAASMALNEQTPASLKQQLFRSLLASEPLPPNHETIGKFERYTHLDIAATLAVGRMPDEEGVGIPKFGRFVNNMRPLFGKTQWDHVLRRINEYFDRLERAAAIADYARFTTAQRELNELQPVHSASLLNGLRQIQKRQDTVSRDRATALTTDFFFGVFPSLAVEGSRIEFRLRQQMDLSTLALALIVHRDSHGTFPGELNALSPRYLTQVPSDRFTGEPLIYRRTDEGFILYSVGENMTDDGGVESTPDGDADDLVVRYPPADQQR